MVVRAHGSSKAPVVLYECISTPIDTAVSPHSVPEYVKQCYGAKHLSFFFVICEIILRPLSSSFLMHVHFSGLSSLRRLLSALLLYAKLSYTHMHVRARRLDPRRMCTSTCRGVLLARQVLQTRAAWLAEISMV